MMVAIIFQAPSQPAHCEELEVQRFVAREVLKLDWGSGSSEVGLTETSEGRFGPQSFFVRDNGSEISVLDSSNHRVLVFSENGSLLRSINIGTSYDDLVVREDNGITVLSVADRAVHVLGEHGDIEEVAAFSGVASPPVGLIWDPDNGVSVETSSGLSYYWPHGLSAEGEIKPPRVFARLGHGPENAGVVEHFTGRQNKANKAFSLPVQGGRIEYIQVLGIDNSHNLYVEVQRQKEGMLVRQLTKLSEDGNSLATVEIPHSSYTYTYNDLRTTEDGSVFQMIASENGVYIICWGLASDSPVASIPSDETGIVFLLDTTIRLNTQRSTHVPTDTEYDAEVESTLGTLTAPSEVISRAEAYRDHYFYVGWENVTPTGGVYCDYKTVETPLTVAGWYQGIPYKWGGFTGLEGVSTVPDCGYYFDGGLGAGLYVGDTNTSTSYGSCCAVGVDCSGFVSQVWGLQSKLSTSGLPGICCDLPALDKLLASDIVIWPGQHTRLFLRRELDGRYTFIEASHSNKKVLWLSYTASQLISGGYQPYRKKEEITLYSIGDRIETLYNINVRSCSSLSCPLVTLEITGSGGTITSGPTEADGYTWWHVSFDDGYSGWSVQCYLQPSSSSCQPPGTFGYVSPPNMGVFPSSTSSLTLIWDASIGADSYDVYFGETSNPPLLANTGYNWHIVNVAPGKSYYWKVTAKNGCGSTESSSGMWYFSVSCDSPGSFSLISPANFSQLPSGTSQTTLTWGTASGATSYDVYFGTSSNPPFATNTASTNTSVAVSSDQTYYWKIIAKNGCGSTDSSSGTWVFSVKCDPPEPFPLLSPASGTQLPAGTTQATLSWASSTGATSYDVYFGTSSSPTLLTTTSSTSASVTVSSGQTYYWKVTANNTCSSAESSSGTWSLSVSCDPPGSFLLSSPGSGNQLPPGTTQATLSWATSSGATSYDVYFGTSSSPSLYTTTSLTSTSVAVSSGQTYYWKVTAKNACSSTESSSGTWSLSVSCDSPGSFVLSSPGNGTQLPAGTTQATLSWEASLGATSYDVYFGTSSSPPLSTTTSSTSTSVAVSSSQTYYWRVVARNDCDTTAANSGTWSLSVSCDPPGQFELLSPSSGTRLPADITQETLTWTASSGATSYDVYFGTSSNPAVYASATSTSIQAPTSSGETYYWRVVAKNSCDSTISSSGTWSFAVDIQKPIFSDDFETGDFSKWSSVVSE
jgi:hypothetical protein